MRCHWYCGARVLDFGAEVNTESVCGSDTNWSLRSRVTDNTRAEYGWSYRTEQIQIILMQEIRDALLAQNTILRQLAEKC